MSVSLTGYLPTARGLVAMPPELLPELTALVAVANRTYPSERDAALAAGPLIARLKAANRTANDATRAAKQRTQDARLAMDHTHLGLQNLLYEKRFLESEIDKCRQFASVARSARATSNV